MLVRGEDGKQRCWWCGDDPLYQAYHDNEWGRPVTEDNKVFERLVLEGFQSGLSWYTILKKRDNFRAAFDGFEIEKVAGYKARKITSLLADAGIVRHRGKIESAINNARCALKMAEQGEHLGDFVWQFQPDPASRPRKLTREALVAMSTTPESKALSKELKRRGWSFVGPTTMYAAMQAIGLVNDHLHGCHARAALDPPR
ncbi:MAG: DNA-3-methyladenine glycosylase I [Gammaproteobacteria bacterium]|nr:DNA-3-methyladenine glycosylase I [Gammaproteobacteria bacterium]